MAKPQYIGNAVQPEQPVWFYKGEDTDGVYWSYTEADGVTPFDFTGYTEAELIITDKPVRQKSESVVTTYTETGGELAFNSDKIELNVVLDQEYGDYRYEMWATNASGNRKLFSTGPFEIR